MKNLKIIFLLALIMLCFPSRAESLNELKNDLFNIANQAKGMIGVAFVSTNDTLLVNNGVRYPMMSVFKLHQALAVANALETKGQSFDSLINVKKSLLDPDTWSPMIKEIGLKDFKISIGKLVEYSLVSSDNNASNLLFQHITSPHQTDRFVKSIAPDTTFSILYSEAEMKQNHSLSYLNFSSPLSCALLLKRIFSDSIMSTPHQQRIQSFLTKVTTGHDRIGKPLKELPGVTFAHKTGSGYRNEAGELMAFNDVGFIRLKDGTEFALAVMIRDFYGSEEEASSIMAVISERILRYVLSS